jgi:lipoprotein-releasing system permease protein
VPVWNATAGAAVRGPPALRRGARAIASVPLDSARVYQALLTRKYLTTKIMPLLATAAVMLSVATVLVTWSVMGGFLQTLLVSGKSLVGDVTITWPNTGFPYYDDLIERLEAHDEIEAATPVIETFGLVGLPDDRVHGVVIKGIEGESFARVTGYEDTLWWKPIDEPVRKDADTREDPRLDDPSGFWKWSEKIADGRSLTDGGQAAAVPGIELSNWNFRRPSGVYIPGSPLISRPDGGVDRLDVWLLDTELTLHVMPLDNAGRGVEVVTRTVPVANEFRTGVFEADSRTVLVRLDLLQRMLKLDAAQRIDMGPSELLGFDPDTGEPILETPEVIGEDPARVTTVLVRGVEGADAEALADLAETVYADFAAAHPGEVPAPGAVLVRTWRDLNATMIAAVEKETALVLFVFGLVCFTTVFLVLAIFWSMVSEKTRDIGILRAIGAGTPGVAWLWLRYGAIVGATGSVLGLVVGGAVVVRINEIHDWLGSAFGLVIWDPSVYYFSEIPSEVDPMKAVFVAVAGVLTCVIGAAIPSIRAAKMDPVRALRFE